tara:strand:- start:8 stop:355 length:348 start_codon:yes stop_codon:yes gene_type:complete
MAIGNKKSINGVLREYFSDIAGIDSGSVSLNDSIRLGLETLGHSGSINNMLKEWAIEQGGAGTSINSSLKAAYLDMQGETGRSINRLSGEYFGNINWNTILTKFEDEDRKWSFID